MRYVENEGALFKIQGPTNAFPDEVWNAQAGKFVPYKGETPKGPDWGQDITEQEAQEMMGGQAGEAGSADAAAA